MLETDRLILRKFTEEDAEACYELDSDPDVNRYTGDTLIESIAQARQSLLDHPIADYAKHGFGRWACVLKENNKVIGFAGLKYLDDLKEVDIGYRLMPAYWGRGLATEAARASLKFGFEQLKLDRIIGLVLPENVASVRVLEKLGMKYVEMIDHHSFHVAQYVVCSNEKK